MLAESSRNASREPTRLSTSSTSDRTTDYAPEREVRFAVVMYGGVSLAIYIYGVAQELLNLVKATAPAHPGSSDPGELAFEDEGTLPVYRKLARLIGAHSDTAPDGGPVRVRFVVDLISGSSAGGLNGVCLATALANDQPDAATRLEPLEQLWVDQGDLGLLLADGESSVGDDGEPDERLELPTAPPSLLNGRRFYWLLAKTLRDQLAREPGDVGRSRLVDQLDLWVTVTDLDGRTVTVPIKNATVSESQHAYRFHFSYDPGQDRNDFTTDFAPFLAFAGRSTSSFPVAFEPMRLDGTLPFGYGIGELWPERLYREYDADAFRRVPLSDGGILDNKPFSYATQDLARRPATLPVDRYLVYVEPDPGDPHAQPAPQDWDALHTAVAALTGIPRSEAIRGDLELVRRRNRAIRRARRLISLGALTPAQQQQLTQVAPRVPREEWLSLGFADMVAAQPHFGPTFPVYHRLKVSVVADYLAGLLARALGVDPDGEQLPELRAIVDRWKRGRYVEEPGERPPGAEFPLTESAFLDRFDIPFRTRRLSFVLTRLRDLESGVDVRVAAFFAAAGCDPPSDLDPAEVRAIRDGLNAALGLLVRLEDDLGLPTSGLREALARSGVDGETLAGMNAEDDDLLVKQAPAGIADAGNPLDTVVQAATGAATDASREQVEQTLGARLTAAEIGALTGADADLKRVVRFHHDAFEAFDLVYLPLSYETAIADTNPITILRVSPRDASLPANVSRGLKGSGLNHFAAFTDATWRRHDIAWGRLNAAEILIRNLLPEGHAQVEPLIAEAHGIITEHYRETAQAVEDRPTTAVGDLGEPLLGDVPVTQRLPIDELVRRGAAIATASAKGQLESRSHEAARAVDLVTGAAEGESLLGLIGRGWSLVPVKWQLVTAMVVVGVLTAGALLGALAGWWLFALAVGVVLGAAALAVTVAWIARHYLRKAIHGWLAKLGSRPELGG